MRNTPARRPQRKARPMTTVHYILAALIIAYVVALYVRFGR